MLTRFCNLRTIGPLIIFPKYVNLENISKKCFPVQGPLCLVAHTENIFIPTDHKIMKFYALPAITCSEPTTFDTRKGCEICGTTSSAYLQVFLLLILNIFPFF